jgi:adenylate cyclase
LLGLVIAVSDLGKTQLKNMLEPVRVYALEVGNAAQQEPEPTPLPGGASEPSEGESHIPLNQL